MKAHLNKTMTRLKLRWHNNAKNETGSAKKVILAAIWRLVSTKSKKKNSFPLRLQKRKMQKSLHSLCSRKNASGHENRNRNGEMQLRRA